MKRKKKLLKRAGVLAAAGVVFFSGIQMPYRVKGAGSAWTGLVDQQRIWEDLMSEKETGVMPELTYPALSQVLVTDPYYDNALEMDVNNMLLLSADRLLAGFRENAGYIAQKSPEEIKALMKGQTRYGGGWENSLIGGHTLGHYLSAMAQASVNPGLTDEEKEQVNERLSELVDGLFACQELTLGTAYEGYLFGATLPNASFQNDPDLQFDNVEKGLANIGSQAWVPWYTMHKILAGLNDAYELAGNEKALRAANRLGSWIAARTASWSEATRRTVLSIEYGGMNDALYQLYRINRTLAEENSPLAVKDYEKFFTAAHAFDEEELFTAVAKETPGILNNKHANTTIPKFIGALARYECDNTQTEYLTYAEKFWEMVVEHHTYITGGNSENEHFGADDVLDAERTHTNNETCNTYNMLKLSRRLFAITGDKKYADYYERTLINAILSSQNHETGLTMYFQPMATGYQKVFGTLEGNFWCCTGSGMENFTKLQDSIYCIGKEAVYVNLYLASVLTLPELTLTQTGSLAEGETMHFTVALSGAAKDLMLRMPAWLSEQTPGLLIDGKKEAVTEKDGYILISKERVHDGMSIELTLPMTLAAHNLPDGPDTYAFTYGPFVLSAKLGTDKQGTASHGVAVTVPSKKAVDSDTIGICVENSVEEFMAHIADHLERVPGTMDFILKGTSESLTFTTHYNQDTESYGIYWTYYMDEEGKSSTAVLAAKKEQALTQNRISVVEQCGRGQYEEQYLLPNGEKAGLVDNGSTAKDAPELSRTADAGKSFAYTLGCDEESDQELYLILSRADEGKPLTVKVGDVVVWEGTVTEQNALSSPLTLSEADEKDYYQMKIRVAKETVQKAARDLVVMEEDKEKTIRVMDITFSGTATESSAAIVKNVQVLRPFGTETGIAKAFVNKEELTIKEDNLGSVTIPYYRNAKLTLELLDENAVAAVNGKVIDEKAGGVICLTGAENTVEITVTAEDMMTQKTYTLTILRDFTGAAGNMKDRLVRSYPFDGTSSGAEAVTRAAVPKAANHFWSYEEGILGKAVRFDGTCGMCFMTDASLLGNQYSVSFWMNPDKIGGQYDPTLTAGTFSPEYWLNLTFNGRLWSSNGAWVNADTAASYVAGTWQMVTVVVDGEKKGTLSNTVTGRLYVNGVCVYEGNVAKDILTRDGAGMYFGVNAWDQYYTGLLDEVMMFNGTLSDAEVSALYADRITAERIKKEDPVKIIPETEEETEPETEPETETETEKEPADKGTDTKDTNNTAEAQTKPEETEAAAVEKEGKRSMGVWLFLGAGVLLVGTGMFFFLKKKKCD